MQKSKNLQHLLVDCWSQNPSRFGNGFCKSTKIHTYITERLRAQGSAWGSKVGPGRGTCSGCRVWWLFVGYAYVRGCNKHISSKKKIDGGNITSTLPVYIRARASSPLQPCGSSPALLMGATDGWAGTTLCYNLNRP